MTTPKVSVLIPTYNYARFLDESIQSVLNQSFTDFELVIVDNCSTDNTVEIVSRYLSDNRVKYHQNEKNLGLAGNWNKCFDYARGEYIKFLCADDKFHPQLLEKFVTVMEVHKKVSIVTSFCEKFGDKTEIRETPFTGYIKGQDIREDLINNKIYNWLGEPTTVMFRSSDLKVGKFNPFLNVTLDLEYWLRLLTVGDCYVLPEVLSYFRIHGETVTAKLKKKKYEFTFDAYQFIKCIKETPAHDSKKLKMRINELMKERATGCASILYKVMPGLHKRENRKFFKKAFKIASSEGVLLQPITKILKF